jgi:MoaA/NifB/PqqE/SkfB family radical SAM enzyme
MLFVEMTEYAQTIGKIFGFFKRRRMFHYIQLGISSRCFLSCVMCPRTCFVDRWNSVDMTMKTYERISKFFPHVENVYLSGWGEPLLNSHLLRMIRIAKTAGCSVGLTTNGALLSDVMSRKMIVLETDVVGVSLAGARAKAHESMRRGSSFERVTRNVRSLASLRGALRSGKPQILLLFMMTKKNLNELPLSVEFAAEVGADGVVATNLDYVADPVHEELRAFSCKKADEELVDFILKAQERARDSGILFAAFPLEMRLVPMCGEDPLNSLYISEDGYVSPCVYLAPPTKDIPRIFCGTKSTISRIGFGNINKQSLFDIWNNHKYVSFRKEYKKRLKIASCESPDHLPQVCVTCYKAYGI